MDYAAQIQTAATAAGVDPALALAVAYRESGLNPAARGAAGEVGLFQLMPATAAGLGVNPYDIGENIAGGLSYLRQLLTRYNGDTSKALAAYNAGPGRVDSGKVPSSTWAYVSDILARVGSPSGLLPAPAAAGKNSSPYLLYGALALGAVSLGLVLFD